eukprot:TRINITY_DN14996_c0_g2_i1.p1 TRINITY_DN14996_c0_g2~~TRINITY_DN14996_c0_g2_i1.p1  ORF type:complete len:900 (+),score=238.97 TRINITY_DN14996_c0_g2_i1:72-2771(+)
MRTSIGAACRRAGRVQALAASAQRRALAARALAASSSSLLVAKPAGSAHRGLGASRASAQARRALAVSAAARAPETSNLRESTRRLREAFWSLEQKAQIAANADAPVDEEAVIARLRQELQQGEEELQVLMRGEALTAGEGRRSVTVTTPTGPGGGPAVRKVSMLLPSVEDMRALLDAKKENRPAAKPEELAEALDKFLKEKYYGKRSDHIGLIAAWGPKVLGDAEGEFGEVGALMDLSLRAFRAGIECSKPSSGDFQFEVSSPGKGKDCLVMPPSNFALLGLKDVFHELLKGYTIIAVVQPRFFAHYLEIQRDFEECGLPAGLFEVVPGITPDADPEVLHEVLRRVDRLQFTGSSAMFRSLVLKAYELGNLRLEHGGEVSGLNKVRLDGVSATHPAAAAGAAWAAMANNGELCTSASIIEFDPATGDSADTVKAALESHSFALGRDPEDAKLNVLLKDGKIESLEVFTAEPAGGFREWWEKQVLAVPRGGPLELRTNQSLGHCVYSPSIEQALGNAVKEDASCLYCVGTPADPTAPCARAGTTGAKLPESVFGGMKSYTFAVAGDHDGVGSLQTLLGTLKRRGAGWRDQEEAFAEYEFTETAESLLEFLSPKDQQSFARQVSNVLEVFAALEPEVSKPYGGQPLVNAEGKSQLVTLTALRPARKSLFIPRGVGLPEDIVKLALFCEMSPLRELPVDLHLLGVQQRGKLQVTDPLKSFLRVVERRMGWKLHWHQDEAQLVEAVKKAEYPPYFFCVKDRHHQPVELLNAVAERGGYLYEGLPTDALSLFRMLTTTQAWTVSCTEAQVAEATAALEKAWKEVGLREEPHMDPEIQRPPRRPDFDIGGGFGAGAGGFDAAGDDGKWDDISSDSESSDDEADEPAKPSAAASTTADAKAKEGK